MPVLRFINGESQADLTVTGDLQLVELPEAYLTDSLVMDRAPAPDGLNQKSQHLRAQELRAQIWNDTAFANHVLLLISDEIGCVRKGNQQEARLEYERKVPAGLTIIPRD